MTILNFSYRTNRSKENKIVSTFLFFFFKYFYSNHTQIGGTLTGITTPGLSGPENNDYKGILNIPQSSRIGTSPSDGLLSYPEHKLFFDDVILYKISNFNTLK